MLCDVWDGAGFSRRLKRKKESVEVPAGALTAIATGRITDFQRAAGLADFRSGVLSRFLVLTSDEPGAYRGLAAALDGETTSGDTSGAPLLRARLRTIHEGLPEAGMMAEFAPAAVALWDATDEAWRSQATTEELEGFAKRRGIQALKLSILRAISRTGGPLVSPDDVAWAISIVREITTGLEAVVDDVGGGDRESERRERAWSTIKRMASANGAQVAIRDVHRSLFRQGSKRDVEAWIESLEAAGLVVTRSVPTGGRPKRVVEIVGTPADMSALPPLQQRSEALTEEDSHAPSPDDYKNRDDRRTEVVTEVTEESPW
jgi:hypothetical protein